MKVGLAKLYAGSGQFDQALSTLGKIPQSRFAVAGIPVEDLYLAGAVFLQEQQSAAAIPLLEKYTAQRSEDAKGWLGLGMA